MFNQTKLLGTRISCVDGVWPLRWEKMRAKKIRNNAYNEKKINDQKQTIPKKNRTKTWEILFYFQYKYIFHGSNYTNLPHIKWVSNTCVDLCMCAICTYKQWQRRTQFNNERKCNDTNDDYDDKATTTTLTTISEKKRNIKRLSGSMALV